MFTLFGIFSPASGRPTASQEAPRKRAFFGGQDDSDAPSKAEEDALYLAGKCPEPPDPPRRQPS
ncbi:hypothetical protein [Devosia sp. A449]